MARLPSKAEIEDETSCQASKDQGWGQGCLPDYEDHPKPRLPASVKDKVAFRCPSTGCYESGVQDQDHDRGETDDHTGYFKPVPV